MAPRLNTCYASIKIVSAVDKNVWENPARRRTAPPSIWKSDLQSPLAPYAALRIVIFMDRRCTRNVYVSVATTLTSHSF